MKRSNNHTILIVDDTKTNVDVLVQTLKKDYNIGVTLNGRDALRYAKANQPDLILLDIVMPKMDGFQVCKKLKSDSKTKAIPVIFITAADKPGYKTKCFKYGGVDYITKQFVISEVKSKIRTHL